MTVNKERLILWVDALRSGQYEQTDKRLKRDGKYCCLGVACEVAVANGLELDIRPFFEDSIGDENLPIEVSRWFGFDGDTQDPLLGNYNTMDPEDEDYDADWRQDVLATEANDELLWSFERIADALENHYELRVPANA